MTGIRFGLPAALLFLIVLPVAAALARRRTIPRTALVLRLVVLLLLTLSLAAPVIPGAGGGQSVIFAVDFSDSIPAQARQEAVNFVRAAAEHRRPGDRIGVVTFGADAIVEEVPSDTPRLAFTSQPAGEATDLALAVRAALSALPPEGAWRIVLATDGNANRGDLAQALALARSQQVEISVVPIVPGREHEVLVEDVAVPAEVRIGERFFVRVAIAATARAEVRLRVVEGNTVIDQQTMTVEAGRAVISIPRVAGTEGLLHYTATITATPDGTAANNRDEALVTVRGLPVVWYVANAPGVIARALAALGMRVRSLTPEALPATAAEFRGTAAVVLDDIPATQLSAAQMEALRNYVGDLGGGLLAVGGAHSFGVGGYAGTPLENVLPVAMDVRHRLAIPSMAIILVIDTSGSMGAFGQEIAKVELAKETAQSVIDLLGERDIIGVISFDQEPRWLVRPTEARFRDQVMDQVSRVQPGGGTNMYPAIQLAADYLRRSQAKVRHAIVISDGQTDPGDFQGLLTRMQREKITVSSVAIGNDADVQIMQNAARWGGGRYYLARDLYSIPQILTAEAFLASRAYIVEERFTPKVSQRGLVDDLAFPPLRGYIATAPKPAASVHLLSPQEDPILAAWQYGVGRAVAFTSDAAPRWGAEWLPWPQMVQFWSRLVRWVLRGDDGGLQVTVEQQDAAGHPSLAGGSAAIILDAYTAGGDPVDGLAAQARLTGPGGRAQTVALTESTPGRYEGRIGAGAAGAYTVTVAARDAQGSAHLRTTGFVVPYSPELRDLTVNRAVLSQITEATGGRVLGDPKEAVAPLRTARTAKEAWPPLAVGAIGLFMLEVTLRRIPAIGHHLLAIASAVRAKWERELTPGEREEDRRYAEADRWKFVGEESPASESMEQAARLYIARLKATQDEGKGKKE